MSLPPSKQFGVRHGMNVVALAVTALALNGCFLFELGGYFYPPVLATISPESTETGTTITLVLTGQHLLNPADPNDPLADDRPTIHVAPANAGVSFSFISENDNELVLQLGVDGNAPVGARSISVETSRRSDRGELDYRWSN